MPSTMGEDLKVLQLNADGWRARRIPLERLMSEVGAHTVVLHETRLRPDVSARFLAIDLFCDGTASYTALHPPTSASRHGIQHKELRPPLNRSRRSSLWGPESSPHGVGSMSGPCIGAQCGADLSTNATPPRKWISGPQATVLSSAISHLLTCNSAATWPVCCLSPSWPGGRQWSFFCTPDGFLKVMSSSA